MLTVFDAYGHRKATRLALTPVGVEDLMMTLGAKPGDLYILSQHPGFHKLVLSDCPEVKVIFTYLKSQKIGRKFLLPVAKLRTAWAKGGADSGDDT